MIPYRTKEEIRKYTLEVLKEYEKRRGKRTDFPIDAGDVFSTLFDLETVFDTGGVLNEIEKGIIGCLYPDGYRSPWGRDKQIVVNATKIGENKFEKTAKGMKIQFCEFDPTVHNQNFTIAHEGMGHYVLHFLKGITGENLDGPIYCRSNDYSPLEWQANFAAGELTQPFDKVRWILDGKEPPEIIDVDIYRKNYREYFDATQGMMECRLIVLGYKLINARYPWADYLLMEKKREKELEKRLKASEEMRRIRETMCNSADHFSDIGSALFEFHNTFYNTFGFPYPENFSETRKKK